MNKKNNFLSFPRQDGKSSKEMPSLFNKHCNLQTTITAEEAIDFFEKEFGIKLLNYQKVFFKNVWDNIKIDSVNKKGERNE